MKRSLFSYEPDTYKKSEVMKNILKPQEEQLEKAQERQDNVIADMYPSKTVHPELWENEYGIKQSESLEQRRKNIISKMRGAGTSTKQMVKDIVESYTDGIVTPEEINDESLINIQIASASSDIQDMDNLEEWLNDMLPAHIGFQFIFRKAIVGRVYSCVAVASGTYQTIATKNKTVTIGTADK